MENEELLLKSVGDLVLDLYTIEELVEMGFKPIKFKWKFDLRNVNLIPILELYDCEGKIIETIESIEFPERLQKLLKEIQLLSNYSDNLHDSNLDKYFLSYIEEIAVDCDECDECDLRDICSLKDD